MNPLDDTRLGPIVASVRKRSEERRARLPLAELERRVEADPARRERMLASLRRPGLSIIAECKRRSPSKGGLGGEADWLERAGRYARGGAAAVSVLTEQDHFGGSPEDFAAVRPCGLPRLRKDFVIDEGMVLESADWDAEALLLLPVILDDAELRRLRDLARDLGIAALVEVHAPEELDRALAVEPDLLGVNARDLRTFEVDLRRVEELLPRVPDGMLRVAESGLATEEDLARVVRAGADAALIGETLMRAEDPEALLASWAAAFTKPRTG